MMSTWEEVGLMSATTLSAVRRQFLVDMAYPVPTDELCNQAGMAAASADVTEWEVARSQRRMSRLLDDVNAQAVLAGSATDMAELLEDMNADDRRLWLITFAVAVTNALEDLGIVRVAA